MSRKRDASSHRSMWLILILAISAGLFICWFIRDREA